MRNIIASIAVVLLAGAPSVQGQGAVNFNNRVTGAGGVVAPIYGLGGLCYERLQGNATTNGGTIDYTGYPLLAGTSYSAELLADTGSGFISISTVQFRTTASLPGFITPPLPAPSVSSLAPTTFKVRAWNNGGNLNSTWADALNSFRAVGESLPFVVTPVASPGNPATVVGLTSFNLTVAGPCIPEPSAVLLGALAGVALLWRRRKVSR